MRVVHGPQSNQRGIETVIGLSESFLEGKGLNRTSVGLKQEPENIATLDGDMASIEPAWD